MAVDMRVKKELKRSPVFETWSTEDKNRFLAIVNPLHQTLAQFDGFPQNVVDAVVESDEFWTAISCSIPMSSTTVCESLMTPLRNIITDLCA